jgi:phasin family protein
MFSIAEQFSTATKAQLESQLKIMNSLASTAVASAEQVIALNLSTTKASVSKSSSAAKQLLQAKDPQEFIKLSTSQPSSFDSLIKYSSELFSIASKAQADLMRAASEQVKAAPNAPVLKLAVTKEAAPAVVKEALAPAAEPVVPKAAKAPVKAKPMEEPVVEVPVVAEAAEAVAEAAKPTPAKPAVVVADASPVALKSVPAAKAKVEAKVEAKAEKQK